MRLFILGGAGYLGSHFAKTAKISGYEIVVYDDLSTGHAWAVNDKQFIHGEIRDGDLLASILRPTDVICHFAAKSVVSESLVSPEIYFDTNVVGTQIILDVMTEVGCEKILCSSTAAVYRPSELGLPLTEDSSIGPVSPYGVSKYEAENLVRHWVAKSSRRSAVIFRYFNAAGAFPEYRLGEAHRPETHLIPNIINALLFDRNEFFLSGDDHPTKDGSCVRDYIHVRDLAKAHLLGVERVLRDLNHCCCTLNLGGQIGHSNFEVIAECERQVGRRLDYKSMPKRLGDPSILISSSKLASQTFGWSPVNSSLFTIIRDAISWHRDIFPMRMNRDEC